MVELVVVDEAMGERTSECERVAELPPPPPSFAYQLLDVDD